MAPSTDWVPDLLDRLKSRHNPEMGMNPGSRCFYGFLRLYSDSLSNSHSAALESDIAPPRKNEARVFFSCPHVPTPSGHYSELYRGQPFYL